MFKPTRLFLLIGIAAIGTTVPQSQAATVGFSLTISADPNVAPGGANLPRFFLSNTSDNALLSSINMTIGDTAFNFDAVIGLIFPSIGSSFSVINPDQVNDGIKTDELQINYTGFQPNDVSNFFVDFDDDEQLESNVVDFRTILFNNGSSVDNSLLTVSFSDLTQLALSLPDGSATDLEYVFSASTDISTVPLPAALPLFLGALAGLGGLGFMKRRRKDKAETRSQA